MKLCLFSHYYEREYIPNYVIYYLEKLSKVVDHIVLLTNDRLITNLDILSEINVGFKLYDNSGYDFGMYYKYLANNPIDCDKLFLVNDSMVCFNDLNTIPFDSNDYDIFGITDSYEVNYHLQSYFLVLNRNAIKLFKSYLKKHCIINDFRKVIETYEIGFSQKAIKDGLKLKSMFDCTKYTRSHMANIAVHFPDILIKKDLPLIKRKVFFNSFKGEELNWLKKVGYNFNTHRDLVEKHKEENLNINYIYEN